MTHIAFYSHAKKRRKKERFYDRKDEGWERKAVTAPSFCILKLVVTYEVVVLYKSVKFLLLTSIENNRVEG